MIGFKATLATKVLSPEPMKDVISPDNRAHGERVT
jgi:hypothetical protein